jgi:hypothetical protein
LLSNGSEYLAEEPDPFLSEGSILRERFLKKLGSAVGDVEIVTLSANRNTRDDIEGIIALASARSIDEIGIVTVDAHLARTMEFARRALKPSEKTRLFFFAAEALLARRYRYRSGVLLTLSYIKTTSAYHRSADREKRGLSALLRGTYGDQEVFT